MTQWKLSGSESSSRAKISFFSRHRAIRECRGQRSFQLQKDNRRCAQVRARRDHTRRSQIARIWSQHTYLLKYTLNYTWSRQATLSFTRAFTGRGRCFSHEHLVLAAARNSYQNRAGKSTRRIKKWTARSQSERVRDQTNVRRGSAKS